MTEHESPAVSSFYSQTERRLEKKKKRKYAPLDSVKMLHLYDKKTEIMYYYF